MSWSIRTGLRSSGGFWDRAGRHAERDRGGRWAARHEPAHDPPSGRRTPATAGPCGGRSRPQSCLQAGGGHHAANRRRWRELGRIRPARTLPRVNGEAPGAGCGSRGIPRPGTSWVGHGHWGEHIIGSSPRLGSTPTLGPAHDWIPSTVRSGPRLDRGRNQAGHTMRPNPFIGRTRGWVRPMDGPGPCVGRSSVLHPEVVSVADVLAVPGLPRTVVDATPSHAGTRAVAPEGVEVFVSGRAALLWRCLVSRRSARLGSGRGPRLRARRCRRRPCPRARIRPLPWRRVDHERPGGGQVGARRPVESGQADEPGEPAERDRRQERSARPVSAYGHSFTQSSQGPWGVRGMHWYACHEPLWTPSLPMLSQTSLAGKRPMGT